MVWPNITNNSRILQAPLATETTIGGGAQVSSTQQDTSIFMSSKKDTNVSSTDQKVSAAIRSELIRINKQYSCENQIKKAMKNENALKRTHVPNLSDKHFRRDIESISEEITNLQGSIAEKCANCKTEYEVKSVIKDIEQEIKQKAHKAKVLAQRGDLAVKLHNKLDSIYADPEKAELVKNIDIDKITSKLSEPVEDVKIEEEKESDKETKANNEETKKAFDKALKEDEISNVVTSLLEYLETGNKDKILDDYIKDDDSETKNKNLFSNQNNLFSTDNKKKNPFFT